MELRSLTRAEADIMKILWQLKKAFVKDIVALMPDPKPAYTTIATLIRILERKNVVAHVAYGNSHEFYPVVSEEEYQRHEAKQLVENYFGSSVSSLVSFFVNDNALTEDDLDKLSAFIEQNKARK